MAGEQPTGKDSVAHPADFGLAFRTAIRAAIGLGTGKLRREIVLAAGLALIAATPQGERARQPDRVVTIWTFAGATSQTKIPATTYAGVSLAEYSVSVPIARLKTLEIVERWSEPTNVRVRMTTTEDRVVEGKLQLHFKGTLLSRGTEPGEHPAADWSVSLGLAPKEVRLIEIGGTLRGARYLAAQVGRLARVTFIGGGVVEFPKVALVTWRGSGWSKLSTATGVNLGEVREPVPAETIQALTPGPSGTYVQLSLGSIRRIVTGTRDKRDVRVVYTDGT